jgi:hypothetical protein
MPPVVRIALVAHHGKGEPVLRAYECLREAGIKPAGYTFNNETLLLLTQKTCKRGVAALHAGGFEFSEV